MHATTKALTSYLLEAVEEGYDLEISSGDASFRLLVGGHSVATSRDPFWTSLSTAEYQRLSTAAGIIVASLARTDPEVEIYESHRDLQARWECLREAA